jgi:hypothetical protein
MINKLKSIQPPLDPVPLEYNQKLEKVPLERNKQLDDQLDLSLKDFIDLDLNRLPSLKLLLKDLKANELLDSLHNSMLHVLDIEKVSKQESEVLKTELIIYVLNEVEKFVLKKSSGNEKKQMAVKILKQLFYDNEILCGIAIDGLIQHITQVGFVRRLSLRLYRYLKKKVYTNYLKNS